jgi:hypothetical protein
MLGQSPRVGSGEPTEAPPGSEWKIRVMIERASRREPLFHPLDGCHGATPPSVAPPEPWWDIELPDEKLEPVDGFEEALSLPVLDTPELGLAVAESEHLVLEPVGRR